MRRVYHNRVIRMKNIVSTLLRKFNIDLKISVKLIAFSIVISTVPLFFLSLVFDNRTQDYYAEKKLNESYQQVVSQYIANLNYKVEIYQTYLTNIGVNQNINSLLRHKNDYTHQEIYDIGKKISTEIGLLIGTRSISELRNIMVYIYDESLPIYSPKVTNVKKVHDEDWYIEIHNDVNKGYVFYDINDHFKDMLSLYKLIIGVNDENYGERLGFVKLDINTDGFFRFEDGSNKTKKGVYVLDGTGQSMWGNGIWTLLISVHTYSMKYNHRKVVQNLLR